MARSRALDLWREGQAAGRASDRLKVAVVERRAGVEDAPAPRGRARRGPRRACARRCGGCPQAQREALVLAYWGGLTADEIARRSQVPLGTAKSRIRLGLAQLRQECGPLAARVTPVTPGVWTGRYARTLVRPPSRGTRSAAGGGPNRRREAAGANPRLLPR